jgi:broad-specificity NMP kinase
VGKTTHSEILAERTGLRHVSVNQIVKDKDCHEGWDDEYQSWIVDEDKVRRRHVTERKEKNPPFLFLFAANLCAKCENVAARCD